MTYTMIVCARCTVSNHLASRFCEACGLPLGSAAPDVGAGLEALGPYEPPDPTDLDPRPFARELATRSGFEVMPAGTGWCAVVPLALNRKQAVYVGPAETDPEGRALVTLVSVCGPANDRDARALLKLNARTVEGQFAIKVLRGEEYFVVIRNLAAEATPALDASLSIRRIAELADGLEDRLTRGRDLY
jgi:hypothetical protein